MREYTIGWFTLEKETVNSLLSWSTNGPVMAKQGPISHQLHRVGLGILATAWDERTGVETIAVLERKQPRWDTSRPNKYRYILYVCISQVQIYPVCMYTVSILIEARASAGISPSETVLISGENNYCNRNTYHLPLIYYKFSLLYDLLKQVRTKYNIFNCKVKQNFSMILSRGA